MEITINIQGLDKYCELFNFFYIKHKLILSIQEMDEVIEKVKDYEKNGKPIKYDNKKV